MWLTFGLTYLGLALGRLPGLHIDRAGIALLGGVAMLALGAASLHDAAAHIDAQTILLLMGLMMFSVYLEQAGFFQIVANRIVKLADRPGVLLGCTIVVCAALSAVLTNDIVCLAVTPLVCGAMLAGGRDPVPYLIAIATASNIGSAATLIGNPQNIYIGAQADLPFAAYSATVALPVFVALVINWASIVLLMPKRLTSRPPTLLPQGAASSLATGQPLGGPGPTSGHPHTAIDRPAIRIALLLLAVVIVLFCFADAERRAVAAAAGGGLLLLARRSAKTDLLARIDWKLLVMFAGLFVVNGAMRQQGLLEAFFKPLRSAGIDLTDLPTLAAVTLGLSNVVSNVPAVILLHPEIRSTAPTGEQASHALTLLALVSTWAGNLTLVGSIANLIVAESAAKQGVRLSLSTYCLVGIPLTLVTTAVATLWLVLI